jgi:predicted dehydrogenase
MLVHAPFTVAWLGCGNLSHAIHFPIIRRMEQFNVVALCDQNHRRLAAASRVFPGARVFTDHRAMASEIKSDVLCVVIPPQLLSRVMPEVISIPRLGLFSEKPFGVGLKDSQEILRCVPAHLKTFCGFNWRFKPGLKELIKLVDEHGPLTAVEAVYHKHSGDREAWRNPKDSLIFTEMCHALDVLLEVGGPVASANFVGSGITEPNIDVLLGHGRFGSGALWDVSCNFASGAMTTRVIAHAAGLRVSLNGAKDLEVTYENRKEHFPIAEHVDKTWAEGFQHEWGAFAGSLQADGDSPSSFARAVETMAFCQTALDDVTRADGEGRR